MVNNASAMTNPIKSKFISQLFPVQETIPHTTTLPNLPNLPNLLNFLNFPNLLNLPTPHRKKNCPKIWFIL